MSLIFRQRLLDFTTTIFMILNKFIEINTLNFKCEVKSHKVRLQTCCNIKFVYRLIKMLSILFENEADSEYRTDS